MASIGDLAVGTRVRVTSRKGATGVVVGFSEDNTGLMRPKGTPLVRVQFGRSAASVGLNFADQMEIVSADA
jgi:hypothetical protein